MSVMRLNLSLLVMLTNCHLPDRPRFVGAEFRVCAPLLAGT